MNDSPDRKVAVFTEPLQLPTEDGAAFLERACGTGKELRQQVERAATTTSGEMAALMELMTSPRLTALPPTCDVMEYQLISASVAPWLSYSEIISGRTY